jgi:2-keto-4-pentenoate hydratase/2-oxohepta-3-ene-1,7-dioic acid hydratase in catechol pathway
MRLAAMRPSGIAVVRNDSCVLVGDFLATEGLLAAGASMIDLIARYDSVKNSIERAMEKGTKVVMDPKRLKPPVERPSKIWAAATNYKRGTAGLEGAAGRGHAQELSNEEILEMAFLKPPSSIVGPEEEILIPEGASTVFPELELCVVIGKEARNLAKSRAMDAVFGYTIILDVTARGYGFNKSSAATRCVRKGFNTFAPLGPWITTRDEIKDPHDLLMRLWVNGDLTQSAKTDAMINGVPELVSYLSTVSTLYPGDLIATGNPDSPAYQRQLAGGDVLRAEIEGIGAMDLKVARSTNQN